MPWMIYHIPGRTAVERHARHAASACKDKSPTFRRHEARGQRSRLRLAMPARAGRGLQIFVGLEELSFPMMAVGACGLMNAVGNLLPRRARARCARPCGDGDLRPARALHDRAARAQQGRVLRHESDPDQVHDEAARPAREATSTACRWCRRRRSSPRGSTACSSAWACRRDSRAVMRLLSFTPTARELRRGQGRRRRRARRVARRAARARSRALFAPACSTRAMELASARAPIIALDELRNSCRRCPTPRRSSASASTTATATRNTTTAPSRREVSERLHAHAREPRRPRRADPAPAASPSSSTTRARS